MHKKPYGEVVFITGAHSGVGQYVAEQLMNEGYKVYGTSRKVNSEVEAQWTIRPSLESRKDIENQGFLRLIYMDVCDEASIEKAIELIIKKEGKIDILINNSGIVTAGAVEDTTTEEAYHQINTNFFGAHRVIRGVLPSMRAKNKGLIIVISSVNGFITLPYQSMYCASKYALETLTEAIRMETKVFGIKAVLIEPGDMKTGNTANRIFAKASEHSVYKKSFLKSMEVTGKNEQGGPEPVCVAKVISKLVRNNHPPVRVVVGFQYKMIHLLKRLLPARLVEYIIWKLY